MIEILGLTDVKVAGKNRIVRIAMDFITDACLLAS